MSALSNLSVDAPIVWQSKVGENDITVRPVTPANVRQAIDISAQSFPGKLERVVNTLQEAARAEIGALGKVNKSGQPAPDYYLVYVNGSPAGVTGYTRTGGKSAELGMMTTSYLQRDTGLTTAMVEFVYDQAEKKGLKLNYDSGEPIFMDSSTSNPLLGQMRIAESRFARQRDNTVKNRRDFLSAFGSVDRYLNDGRVVDLTDRLARQVRDPMTESFEQLNNKLFPVVEERELFFADNVLKLYVQSDKTGKYAPNERRVLGVLDEKKEKIIGAIVYSIAVLPESLRKTEGVDAVRGVTYLMTDADHRAKGLGDALMKEALGRSAAFVRSELGTAAPKIMDLTEQNDPNLTNFQNSITDFSGALIGPIQRARFWGNKGQRRVDGFPYIQISLRQGLEPYEGLGLHVALPGKMDGKAEISSDLLRYAVKNYADLCLNKQQRPIETDSSWLAMQKALDAQASFALAPRVDRYAAAENKLWAAQIQETVGGLGQPAGLAPRLNMTVGNLVQAYEAAVDRYSTPSAAAPLVRRPGLTQHRQYDRLSQ